MRVEIGRAAYLLYYYIFFHSKTYFLMYLYLFCIVFGVLGLSICDPGPQNQS